MYGTSKAWADNLRCFRDGKLVKSKKGNWPEENDIGLPMENVPPPTMHKLLNGERLFSKFRPSQFVNVSKFINCDLRSSFYNIKV